MQNWLGSQVAWHAATVAHLLRTASLWAMLVPAAGALLIAALNLRPEIAPYLTKESAEIASPIILGLGSLLALWIAASRPHPYYKWQALFVIACFLRELHFQGTNSGFYIALVVLLWWLSHARERLAAFLNDRRIVTLLVAVLWTYFISKTFDRHLWDNAMSGRLTRDLFEENLEILGHLLLVGLVMASMSVNGRAAPRPA